MNIQFKIASQDDKNLLMDFFKHYNNPIVQQNRTECYTSHNSTLIMIIDGNYGGCIQWYIKEDPNLGVVELEEFYMKEEYRNRGLGKKLFDAALKAIQDKVSPLHSVYLFTNKENAIMEHICYKSGFQNVAEIPDLFEKNVTEILYLKFYL